MKKWLAVLTALAVAIAASVLVVRHRAAVQRAKDQRASAAVARQFLAAWQAKQYDGMGPLTAADPDAGDSFRNLEDRLKATSVTVTAGVLSPDARHLTYTATLQLKDLGPLSWSSTVDTVKTSEGWRIAFSSGTVFPGLQNGEVLSRSQPLTSRGDLVDRHGAVIRTASPDLAANVLGRATAPLSGLERLYDAQLMGSSGGIVQITSRSSGEALREVKRFPAKAAAPVTTTLDLRLQAAAAAAVAKVAGQAAMVVLDAATGEVRAVVNQPVVGLPTAFQDEAPGSTFKVIVAYAALLRGLSPSSTVACPEKAVFGGKQFRNDEPLPASMTFATAFARSCNTAFLTLADGFPKGTVGKTAAVFGFDRGDLLPIAGHGGSVPPPTSTSEAYADIIGQGRVEASPLLLASMSAAVASGTWHQPHLVSGTSPSAPLVPAAAAALRGLMSGVVTSGTAAGAGLPPGTAGKTGTAQYGTTLPLKTHAWFTGFAGGLAFCVYVKDGASGGRVAAPVAAAFLKAVV